jgi:dolichol-phosphate mannosyltransferase
MIREKNASLAVIIPAYNEEKGILKCIRAVMAELKTKSIKFTLIIVNDGSTDTTLDILNKARKTYGSKLHIVTYRRNKGYGLAIAKGIQAAIKLRFTYGLIMDSDLTNNPKYIPQFFKKIQEGYDCVKGSRYIQRGSARTVPINRKIPSYAGNIFAGLFFRLGIRDYTNGFRIVKLAKLKKVTYKEPGFAHILEEVYYLKKNGGRFAEIPITLTVRKSGKSKFRYSFATFISYAKYPMQMLTDSIYGKHN